MRLGISRLHAFVVCDLSHSHRLFLRRKYHVYSYIVVKRVIFLSQQLKHSAYAASSYRRYILATANRRTKFRPVGMHRVQTEV